MKCEVCTIDFDVTNDKNVGFLGIKDLVGYDEIIINNRLLNLDNYFCMSCAYDIFKEESKR